MDLGIPGRPRVLIVDDTPENIRLLLAFLRKTCEVVAATDGHKALELARAAHKPDLILLDVVMPGLSGYQVCQQLKEDPATCSIPVIFVTGQADTGQEEKGFELGAVDYITKPFHPEVVRARVRNHLELKRHRDHLEIEVRKRTEALLEARAAQQRLESELEVASRLQFSMLPARAFVDYRWLGCQVATLLQAARVVGGDLYDYFFLDETHFLFLLGDVSDKGVVAALFMVKVRTLIRTLAPTQGSDPAALLQSLNQALCEDNPACMFVTMICGVLEVDSAQVLLCSAGHEPPILVDSQGPTTFLDLDGGPALGLCPEATFHSRWIKLSPSQTLVFYTDGIPEACNEANEPFGEERFRQETLAQADQEPSTMVARLAESLKSFVGKAEAFDDVTLMALKTHLERQVASC